MKAQGFVQAEATDAEPDSPRTADGLVSESKFVAPATCEPFAAALLEHYCRADPGHPRGTVCSVYFDHPGLPSYLEKLNGDFLKAKIRLRWYQEDTGGPSVPVWLEVKRRIGAGRLKERRPLVLSSAWLERAPWDNEELCDLVGRVAAQITGAPTARLVPVIHLRYERSRHVCSFTGARVNLDTRIGIERFNPGVLPRMGQSALAVAVLEIKVKGPATEIPWLGRAVRAGFRSASFSKFGALITRLV